ncbi:MAG: hypothetical protein O3C43_21700 [Verrucomicrobia bacterium]|nr:hypothetical protein [Verrucomicrobiota bacterium]
MSLVIVACLALIFFIKSNSSELQPSPPVTKIVREKSIAVLPLINLSPDPENAFFADGVQEDILTNLSKVNELLVIARTSTLGYKNTDKTAKEIGEELGVWYLVEGSVRRAGNQVLVSVKLIDSQTGGQLWADDYNRKLTDIFTIQAEIARKIAQQLEAAISPEALKLIDRRPTENLEAYEDFVKARQMILNLSAGGNFELIALLENAVALDPAFAEAWAFLAWQRVSFWFMGYDRNNPELLAKAHHAMENAVRLGQGIPHVPHAQSNFAFIEHGDYDASIDYLLEALTIDPNFSFSRRALGARYSELGRLAEAQLQFEEALRLDPLSFFWNLSLKKVYTQRGMLDKAHALIERNLGRTGGDTYWQVSLAWNEYLKSGDRNEWFSGAFQEIPQYWNNPYYKALYHLNDGDLEAAIENLAEADPNNWPRHHSNWWWDTSQTKELLAALIWFRVGDRSRWIAEAAKAKLKTEARIEENPGGSPFNFSNLVLCHALEGNRKAMEPCIAKTRETSGSQFNISRYQFGCEMDIAAAHLILGDNETAIETLENASRMESAYNFSRILNIWNIFDRLRGNPRFDALLLGKVLGPDSEKIPMVTILEKSIAVLPLENLSPDPENAFFADGVQEDILTNLSKVKDLLVIGRTSTLGYRETTKSSKEIGEELGVWYLVEGSVRRAGNQVLVNLKLIDSQSGGQLWAENYKRDLDDIFTIQATIAKDVASELHTAISPDEIDLIERIPTKNQEAYDYFVKANLGAPDRISLYEKAVELDPNFAEAWAFLAWYRAVQWRFVKQRNDPSLLAEIHSALDQAKRINSNLPHVFHAQGNVIDIVQGDTELAIEYFLKALEIDPNFWYSKQALALRCHNLGRLAMAEHYYKDAIRTEPISANNGWLVDVYVSRKQWDGARAIIEKNLNMGDVRYDSDGFWSRYKAFVDYLESGDREAYSSALYRSPGYDDNPWVRSAKLICNQDYDAALPSLAEIVPGDYFKINFGITGPLLMGGTWEIQSSLIWFVRGNEAQWLFEVEKAKRFLKGMVENDALADPVYRSNLAICYALEGDREKMESAMVKVRESTAGSLWKFRRQARCEAHIAICYLILGENDKAIEILEAANQMNPSFLLNRYVEPWFIFDRLRGNPRFDVLLKD